MLNQKIENEKLILFQPEIDSSLKIPLFSASVSAGFPSVAEDHIENRLDLNRLLIDHPIATFFVRVEGDSMRDAHIQSGDILIVDRSLPAEHHKIVVAVLNGEFTVKRLIKKGEALWLAPENPRFAPIQITAEMEFEVWGVVTYIIHKAR